MEAWAEVLKQAGLTSQIPASACKQDFANPAHKRFNPETNSKEKLSPLCSTLPEAKWPK